VIVYAYIANANMVHIHSYIQQKFGREGKGRERGRERGTERVTERVKV
jgi:hypothetical protein